LCWINIGGAIHIATSATPSLIGCIFFLNVATQSSYGNDVSFNSSNLVYSQSLYQSSCSTSAFPHISGNTSSGNRLNFNGGCTTTNMNLCSFKPDMSNCVDFETEDDCLNLEDFIVVDGPCLWILKDSNGNEGTCKSEDSVVCGDFVTNSQCINTPLHDGSCYYDVSQDNIPKCKTYVSETSSCSNSMHFTMIDRNCVIKSCLSRTVADGTEFPCGSPDCFFDIMVLNKEQNIKYSVCVEECTNPAHYLKDITHGICEEKLCENRLINSSSPRLCGSVGCFMDLYNEYKCTESCSFPDHYEAGDGICNLKKCDERIANLDDIINPCSSFCFLINSDERSCGLNCSSFGCFYYYYYYYLYIYLLCVYFIFFFFLSLCFNMNSIIFSGIFRNFAVYMC
jgi:hypothetical protein